MQRSLFTKDEIEEILDKDIFIQAWKELNIFEKLNKLDTKNIEPLTSVAETTLKFRNDEVKSKDIRDQILKNSPDENEDFFVVPKVVE